MPYPLSLHDALPISVRIAALDEVKARLGALVGQRQRLSAELDEARGHATRAEAARSGCVERAAAAASALGARRDRKSTRLNSSHLGISYSVFCFKK